MKNKLSPFKKFGSKKKLNPYQQYGIHKVTTRIQKVPENGTEICQPLDRRTFGILKSKLSKTVTSNIYLKIERFEIITKLVVISKHPVQLGVYLD